ncbi:MAG: DUF3379 family protein [Acidobacteria bacterium]|nr:DUF3379 family protein [Acidobacteriota bacterium]
MMNCSEVKELIQLYMDNELDACNTLTVQRHLEICPICTRQLDDFIRQDQLLQQAFQAEVQDTSLIRQRLLTTLHQDLANANREGQSGRQLWLRSWLQRPALLRLAAVLVVAMMAALFLWRGTAPFINDKVYADAVEDHADHCTIAALGKLPQTVSDLEQIDRMCAANGGFKKMPELSAFGFTDARARYCHIENIRVLHLVYQNATQAPLSLFLCPHTAKLIDEKLLTLKRQGYEVASFTKAGVDVLVVASLSEQQTTEIARKIAESM